MMGLVDEWVGLLVKWMDEKMDGKWIEERVDGKVGG